MNKMISPGELAKGMYFTILEWLPREVEHVTDTGNVASMTITDNSWKGDVLQVVAIDLPYVAAKKFDGFRSTITLDMRRVRLMELSKEYVEAVLGDKIRTT